MVQQSPPYRVRQDERRRHTPRAPQIVTRYSIASSLQRLPGGLNLPRGTNARYPDQASRLNRRPQGRLDRDRRATRGQRPPRSLRHAPIDPFQQHRELCRRHRHLAVFRHRPYKACPLMRAAAENMIIQGFNQFAHSFRFEPGNVVDGFAGNFISLSRRYHPLILHSARGKKK